MIAGFKHKGLKRFYDNDDPSGLRPDMVERIRDLLAYLDAADSLKDLSLPSLGLHPLHGDRKGDWAVKVTKNWRVTFRPEIGSFAQVNLEDYH